MSRRGSEQKSGSAGNMEGVHQAVAGPETHLSPPGNSWAARPSPQESDLFPVCARPCSLPASQGRDLSSPRGPGRKAGEVRCPLRALNLEKTCGRDHVLARCLPKGVWGRLGRWLAIVQPDIYYAKICPVPTPQEGPATPILRICRPGARRGLGAPLVAQTEAET